MNADCVTREGRIPILQQKKQTNDSCGTRKTGECQLCKQGNADCMYSVTREKEGCINQRD
jgi:hypothetical protein